MAGGLAARTARVAREATSVTHNSLSVYVHMYIILVPSISAHRHILIMALSLSRILYVHARVSRGERERGGGGGTFCLCATNGSERRLLVLIRDTLDFLNCMQREGEMHLLECVFVCTRLSFSHWIMLQKPAT